MATCGWVVPVVGAAIEHREALIKGAGLLGSWLRKYPIAFTGMAGAGKTVLYDHLRGAAHSTSYRPPGKSESLERAPAKLGKKRMALHVVPGQDSLPRVVALDRLFLGRKPPLGVVHVVCNGFNELRSRYAADIFREDLQLRTVEALRNKLRELELDDLDETCDRVRQAIHRRRRTHWMIVAVAKADLFADNLEEAQAYYETDPNSPFVKRLRRLQSQAGSDSFRWAAAPVCCWLEDYIWNGSTVQSRVDSGRRNQMLLDFAKRLEDYSAT